MKGKTLHFPTQDPAKSNSFKLVKLHFPKQKRMQKSSKDELFLVLKVLKGKDGLKIISALIRSKALFVTSCQQNGPNSSKLQRKLSFCQNWGHSCGRGWTGQMSTGVTLLGRSAGQAHFTDC